MSSRAEVKNMTEKQTTVVEEKVTDEQFGEPMDLEKEDKPIVSGGGKPKFDTVTKGVISEVEFRKATSAKADSQGKEYKEVICSVTTEYEGGVKSYDNYGGLRFYSEQGEFWSGDTSHFGKLKKLVEDHHGKVEGLRAMKEKLVGAQVGVKSIVTTFNGKEFAKNIIHQLY